MHNPTFATVPVSFVHNLLEAAAFLEQGRQDAMIEQSGIAPILLKEGAARVPLSQFATLFRLLAQDLDDELPCMFSRPVKGGALKLLCLSMLDSTNLKSSLYRLARFFCLVLDDVQIECTEKNGRVSIVLVPVPPAAGIKIFSQEILLKVIHGVISWLARRKIPLSRIDLHYAKPEHAGDYVFLYPGPAYFDQAQTAFHFDVQELERPILQSKHALNDFVRQAPLNWLSVSFAEHVISHRVRRYLEQQLCQSTTIVDVAKALRFSVRTLSRRLDIEGTTFQGIKDELRRDMAIQRLTKTNIPIADIGNEIGFDDPTTFHRAFRRWTGTTPGAYRPK